MPTEWLQAGETARRLGVSRESVRQWAHAGRIPHQQTSTGTLLFASTDVEKLRSGDAGVEVDWPAVLIKERVWNQLDTHDGGELGGWLFGQDLRDRLVVDELAEESDAERTGGTIDLDLSHALEISRSMGPSGRVLGDWHGHDRWGRRWRFRSGPVRVAVHGAGPAPGVAGPRRDRTRITCLRRSRWPPI